ncbi:MAG: type II toxin-antitoxin system RelE/ParE family toxin [Methylobacteriaceae bacterium]|nr:type II toxin-antitoxin system RelE/ParE family toxin [Methylobacteriaceae bacterium]
MRIFATKEFARFARKARLGPDDLVVAARAVEAGRWDVDLGGGVFKQRIARAGHGKSGGFRTLIVFQAGRHSFLVHGFAKNQKANVTAQELRALKRLADVLLGLDDRALDRASTMGEIVEVSDREREDEN